MGETMLPADHMESLLLQSLDRQLQNPGVWYRVMAPDRVRGRRGLDGFKVYLLASRV
jgi:hypothetical protein